MDRYVKDNVQYEIDRNIKIDLSNPKLDLFLEMVEELKPEIGLNFVRKVALAFNDPKLDLFLQKNLPKEEYEMFKQD